MNKKYELTDKTITIMGHALHRIKAVRDFGRITAGELGGFIEKEENLSHEGNVWVSDCAKVYGEAEVLGNAQVSDSAKVYDNAKICDNAEISENARASENTSIHGNAKVYGNAKIYGDARVYGNAKVCSNARVYGHATVCDNSEVSDYAGVYDDAYVSNNEKIRGCTHCVTDISADLEESIRVQTGLIPVNGCVIAYKQVRKDLTSFYDPDFKYEVGKIAEAEDPEESTASCASGLHFANANYWSGVESVTDSTFLIAKIKLEDIITVQAGKIRCRKAEIIGKYDIKR